jgi:hypothetical protein
LYKEFAHLGRALQANSYVQLLDFTACGLEVPEAELLGSYIETTRSLRWLDLSDNNLGNRGCNIIAQSLISCTTLRFLSLRNNHVSNEGMLNLIRGMIFNFSVYSMDISANSLVDQHHAHLLAYLLTCNEIRDPRLILTAMTLREVFGPRIPSELIDTVLVTMYTLRKASGVLRRKRGAAVSFSRFLR